MRHLAAILALAIALALPARADLSPGMVWPYQPAGIPAASWVATSVGGLLAAIDATTLTASTPGTLATYYYLPAPQSDADWARFWIIINDWKKLSDADYAKIRFRIY